MLGVVEKMAMHINSMPQWATVALFLAIIVVVVKFVQSLVGTSVGKRSNYFRSLNSKQHNTSKGLARKKKSKKSQHSSEHLKKDEQITDFDLAISPTPTLEDVEIRTVKKSDKRKNKSKKRKNQVEESPSNPLNILEQGGEWQTVSTKEQRSVLKREKKRQDSIENANVSFNQSKPSIFNPTFTPISSMAKEIAPRFARAAGEEWRENVAKPAKKTRVKPDPEVVTRSPMTSSVGVVPPLNLTNWQPSNPSITDLWNRKAELSSSIPSVNPRNTLWEAVTTNSNDPLQHSAGSWSNIEEWVHVGSDFPGKDWSSNELTRGLHWSGPVGLAQAVIKREEFLLEPEGISDDPWNDKPDYDVTGDWSPPDATWSNSIDAWTAPVNDKKRPIYFDESSDDGKRTSSLPANYVIGAAPSSGNAVVGAGPDMMSSVNQTSGKKQRRRRRKKQLSQESIVGDDVEGKGGKVEECEVQGNAMDKNEVYSADNSEAWSAPKPIKKKKNRVRRED